jgi:hypothetical protein
VLTAIMHQFSNQTLARDGWPLQGGPFSHEGHLESCICSFWWLEPHCWHPPIQSVPWCIDPTPTWVLGAVDCANRAAALAHSGRRQVALCETAANMGKKGEAGRSFAVLGRGGRPVTKARLCAFLAVGFVLGLSLGFIFMGTVHAVSLGGWPAGNSHKALPPPPAAAACTLALPLFTPASCPLRPQFLEVGATKHHGQQEGTEAAGERLQASAAGGEQQQDSGGGGGSGGWPTEGDTVHILYTSNGSPYTNYQASQAMTSGSCHDSSSRCCFTNVRWHAAYCGWTPASAGHATAAANAVPCQLCPTVLPCPACLHRRTW